MFLKLHKYFQSQEVAIVNHSQYPDISVYRLWLHVLKILWGKMDMLEYGKAMPPSSSGEAQFK